MTGATFADILDAFGGAASAPPPMPLDTAGARRVWLYGLYDPRPTVVRAPRAVSSCPTPPAGHAGDSAPEPPSGFAPGAQHPRAALTADERAAMAELRELGACWLADDASRREVKRAFRELAKRLHPDRHPRADQRERQEWARRFARAREAARLLIERPGPA